VIYKIITKTATIRVEPFMDKLISGCQTAFIKRRDIMEGVLSLHEIIHEAKRKNNQGIIILKKPMTRLTGNIQNGTLCVKINDRRGKDFGSHRGVRQGDPFSPFLFDLAAEGLTKMIHQA
jgi:hypothetical protein